MSRSNKNIKTIALVANSTWNIFNFRLNLIDKFLSEGMNVVVIAPVDEYLTYKEKYPAVKHYDLKKLDRDSKNPIKDILLTLELIDLYRKILPDIVVHFTNKPNIYGSIAAKYVGIEKSISVVTGLGYAFIHKGFAKWVLKNLYRYSNEKADHIIFENQDDRSLFIDLDIIDEKKATSVKGCGVNVGYYSPEVEYTDNIVFTFIGRLLFDKGIIEFINAAKILKNLGYSNLTFNVVGQIDEENPATISKSDLLKWVDEDIIEYHGFATDIREHISTSTCVVLPSYREGMPRTIMEAMAMAKPVIVTNVPGCKELVIHGHNGYIVNVRDSNSLALAMENLSKLESSERIKMGKSGRKIAVSNLSDKIIARDIYNIIMIKTKIESKSKTTV